MPWYIVTISVDRSSNWPFDWSLQGMTILQVPPMPTTSSMTRLLGLGLDTSEVSFRTDRDADMEMCFERVFSAIPSDRDSKSKKKKKNFSLNRLDCMKRYIAVFSLELFFLLPLDRGSRCGLRSRTNLLYGYDKRENFQSSSRRQAPGGSNIRWVLFVLCYAVSIDVPAKWLCQSTAELDLVPGRVWSVI